jgi:hypothetical protein
MFNEMRHFRFGDDFIDSTLIDGFRTHFICVDCEKDDRDGGHNAF